MSSLKFSSTPGPGSAGDALGNMCDLEFTTNPYSKCICTLHRRLSAWSENQYKTNARLVECKDCSFNYGKPYNHRANCGLESSQPNWLRDTTIDLIGS
jgi:hypothetical protein